MKSLVSSAEALIVRASLATMLAILLSLLFLGGLNSTPAAQAAGCPNYNGASFSTRAGGDNYFHVNSYYDCTYSINTSSNATWVAATGSAGYINAQTDTWLTNSPSSSGTRYGETGRSGVYGYPTDGNYRFVQEAAWGQILHPVEWGCMWFNLPDYYLSYDYNCADMV